jgi:hypothetical protein
MKRRQQQDNSSIERESTGGNRAGLQTTAQPMGPMTVEHEQWDEFIDRLLSAARTFDSTDAFPVSRHILAEMGMTPNEVEQSISYFMGHGGFCDYEVWLNVERL